MWGQREAGRAEQGIPTQTHVGGGAEAWKRTRRVSDRGQTKGRQGGVLKPGSWGVQGERPRGIAEIPVYRGDTKKKRKNPEGMWAKRQDPRDLGCRWKGRSPKDVGEPWGVEIVLKAKHPKVWAL